MSNRRPPKNADPRTVPQAEQALIGSVLLDPSVLDHVTPIVSAADFCDPSLGALYGALTVLCEARRPVTDFAWLVGELARMDVPDDVRTAAAIARFGNTVVHAGNAVYFAEQVVRAATLSRWAGVAVQLTQRAGDPAVEPEQIAAWLDGQLAQVSQRRPAFARGIGEIAADVAAELDEPPPTIGSALWTGLLELDEALGPIMPGELGIIAARTGCGKTSLATQWAEHAAAKGRPVLFVSLEMRDAELVKRMLCSRAGIDSRDLRGGNLNSDDRAGLVSAVASLGGLPLRL